MAISQLRKNLLARIHRANPQQLEATLSFFDCDQLRRTYVGLIRDMRDELARRKLAADSVAVAALLEADAAREKTSLWPVTSDEREEEEREHKRDCGDAAEWDSPGVRR